MVERHLTNQTSKGVRPGLANARPCLRRYEYKREASAKEYFSKRKA